jgi:uncharacterized protein (DUF58 family)
LRPLIVFIVAFPLLWVGLATTLSYSTARALRMIGADAPAQIRAMEKFVLSLTLTLERNAIPALGVLTNATFATDEVTIELGPWAEVPLLEGGRSTMTHWEVFAKQRGLLFIGPYRAAVELPGSFLRATAIFDSTTIITVLPAVYHLQPFVDSLLAGRHVAVGRYEKLPTATEEYVGARQYRPGDSPKLIHRVLSLRALGPQEFYVREFQDPSREDLSVVLDTAPPADGDEPLHLYRLEKAIAFTSALCRVLAARRLTVRFVYQRGIRDVAAMRIRPIDADLEMLDLELTKVELSGDRSVISRVLLGEVQRHGAAVIFVSLRPREPADQQRLPMVTLTPDHVPVFTRDVAVAQ